MEQQHTSGQLTSLRRNKGFNRNKCTSKTKNVKQEDAVEGDPTQFRIRVDSEELNVNDGITSCPASAVERRAASAVVSRTPIWRRAPRAWAEQRGGRTQ